MTTTLPAGWKPRLACPFCGSNFLFTEPDEYGSGGQWVSPIHVGCNDCKAEQVGDTEEEAVSRWNARATPPASAQDEPITVSLDPDPRGVSVGVWQGSSCIYTGAHAIPGSAPDAPLASMARAIFGDKIGGQMDAMAGAPSLSSLRGLAPGACDGMKSEDYVNKVRNGDWSSPHCTPASVAPGDAQDERSPTHGMTLGERIAHVGGRTNAQSYIEFGSPMAVNALIQHVLRDLDWTRQDDDGAYQARYRLPGGQWSTWGHVVCGVKGHEQELRYLPGERRPAPAAGDALDAQRYRWLRDHACNSLHLTRDGDHACNYLTAAQWIESCPEDFQDDAPEEIERMKATNTIWRLQVYPSTPIGFWVLHASTLDAAIDAALAAQVPQQGEA